MNPGNDQSGRARQEASGRPGAMLGGTAGQRSRGDGQRGHSIGGKKVGKLSRVRMFPALSPPDRFRTEIGPAQVHELVSSTLHDFVRQGRLHDCETTLP